MAWMACLSLGSTVARVACLCLASTVAWVACLCLGSTVAWVACLCLGSTLDCSTVALVVVLLWLLCRVGLLCLTSSVDACCIWIMLAPLCQAWTLNSEQSSLDTQIVSGF